MEERQVGCGVVLSLGEGESAVLTLRSHRVQRGAAHRTELAYNCRRATTVEG